MLVADLRGVSQWRESGRRSPVLFRRSVPPVSRATPLGGQTFDKSLINWWARLDSNQRPKDYESSALTN
jgi:hypothetical protein